MSISTQKISDETATAAANDATVTEVISAWDKTFQGLKTYFRTHATLVAKDLRLSIKAIVVSLISILFLVGLGLLIWTTLLAGLFYGLTAYGIHWIWAILVVLVLNCIALLVTKRILASALNSVSMKTSIEQIFNSDNV